MPWDDLIGQPTAINILRQAAQHSNHVHAYLFSGPRGTGKLLAAKRFAQALNCLSDAGRPCGNCEPCRKIEAGSYPDVKVLVPEGTSFRVEQIRQLRDEIWLKPVSARQKVFILSEAEKMNEEAANTLLKTMEEPPEGNILILLSEYPEALLPTILSRSVNIRFRPLPPKLIEEEILREFPAAGQKAKIVARLAQGGLSRARELMISQEFWDKRRAVLDKISRLDEIDILERLNWAEELEKEKDLDLVLDMIEGFYHDVLLWQETGEPSLLNNYDYAESLAVLALRHTLPELIGRIRVVQQARHYLKHNANTRLVLEVMLLDLPRA